MKILFCLFIIFFASEAKSQHPKIFISEDEIIEYKIKELKIVLDSASDNYKLPFDFIKKINYNSNGKKTKEIWYRSEAYRIKKQQLFTYYSDSVKIISIDSFFFKFPTSLSHVDTTITIHRYKGKTLQKEERYSSNKKLLWSKYYDYYSSGKIKKETIVDDNHESIAEYFYDKNDQLIKSIMSLTGYQATKFERSYYYEDNKKLEVLVMHNRTGTETTTKTETLFDNNGQEEKIIEYDTDNKIRLLTNLKYDKNGLLKEEIVYEEGDKFAYKFSSLYQK